MNNGVLIPVQAQHFTCGDTAILIKNCLFQDHLYLLASRYLSVKIYYYYYYYYYLFHCVNSDYLNYIIYNCHHHHDYYHRDDSHLIFHLNHYHSSIITITSPPFHIRLQGSPSIFLGLLSVFTIIDGSPCSLPCIIIIIHHHHHKSAAGYGACNHYHTQYKQYKQSCMLL